MTHEQIILLKKGDVIKASQYELIVSDIRDYGNGLNPNLVMVDALPRYPAEFGIKEGEILCDIIAIFCDYIRPAGEVETTLLSKMEEHYGLENF